MMRASVARAAGFAQVAAALLLCVVGVRFAVAGMLFAIEAREPALASAAGVQPAAPVAKPSAKPASGGAPSVASGSPLRVPLVVQSSDERAEVLVGGSSVGHTPYLGEVSCKAGERLKIDVLPRKGPPRSFEPRCAPGAIRLGP